MGEERIPYVPEWLLGDEHFRATFDAHVHQWAPTRPRGLDAIEEFSKLLTDTATTHLRTHVLHAVTPEHRLGVTASLLRKVQAGGGGLSTQAFRRCYKLRWISTALLTW